MPSGRPGETEIGGDHQAFRPTAWTEVLSARDAETSEARLAWDQLVSTYWKPVYFHVRRKGNNVEDAKDLTQHFFTFLIEREALRSVDPAKGSFRAFIRACLDNFLHNEFDRRMAAKRRPNLDAREAETHFVKECSFERDWALTVLDRAFGKLKQQSPREARVVEAQRHGKTNLSQLAQELGTSEANVKVLAHRGRKHLRELLLRELRATVLRPGDEQEELADLFQAFSL